MITKLTQLLNAFADACRAEVVNKGKHGTLEQADFKRKELVDYISSFTPAFTPAKSCPVSVTCIREKECVGHCYVRDRQPPTPEDVCSYLYNLYLLLYDEAKHDGRPYVAVATGNMGHFLDAMKREAAERAIARKWKAPLANDPAALAAQFNFLGKGIDARRAPERAPFQSLVRPWMLECFGVDISRDVGERCFRFLEEAVELVQALGMNEQQCDVIIDYVYERPVGEVAQEVGGTMVTLAALCNAVNVNMDDAGYRELGRCWADIEKIRDKQKAKRERLGYSPEDPRP